MRRLALVIPALLLALAVVTWPGAAGQGDATPAPDLPRRAAERVPYAVLYTDGSWATVTPIPQPSETPSPTSTPSPVPSATPTATATPSPAPTATPTRTPDVDDTPTPERTPVPTVEPSPVTCELIMSQAVSVRSEPSTSSQRIAFTAIGDYYAYNLFVQTGGYLWGRVHDGRYAGRFIAVAVWGDATVSQWWVMVPQPSYEGCFDVTGWPYGDDEFPLYPPSPIVRAPGEPLGVLFHAVPGANAMEMEIAWSILRQRGIPFGVLSVDDPDLCAKAEASGGLCIWRSNAVGDCGDILKPPVQAANEYMLRQRGPLAQVTARGQTPSYIAIHNECALDRPDLAKWASDFVVQAVAIARAWQWPPLVAPNFYAHQPDAQTIAIMLPAWRALAASGGAMGLHAYSPTNVSGGLAAYGHMAEHRYVSRELERLGVYGLPLFVTEAARGYGNSCVDVDDFVTWIGRQQSHYEVIAVALWTAGRVGTMPECASLDGDMVALASALR